MNKKYKFQLTWQDQTRWAGLILLILYGQLFIGATEIRYRDSLLCIALHVVIVLLQVK